MFDGVFYLGSVPEDEGYQQYGIPHYHVRAQNESRIYKKQLLRTFLVPNPLKSKISFELKAVTGEQCIHYEIVIKFDVTNQAATEFAENVKANRPKEWDEKSIKDLRAMHLIPD
jgi:hypothetical protein